MKKSNSTKRKSNLDTHDYWAGDTVEKPRGMSMWRVDMAQSAGDNVFATYRLCMPIITKTDVDNVTAIIKRAHEVGRIQTGLRLVVVSIAYEGDVWV